MSNADFPQVLKDAHRPEDHAIAVVGINDLVPRSFSKVVLEYLLSGPATGEVGKAYYYNTGTSEVSEIDCREDYLGTAELTSINFINSTPAALSGKYFIIYDNVGSVGVWFDVDNASTPPITGALRDIEIDIASGDAAAAIALKFKIAMDVDAQFIAVYSSTIVIVSAIQVGERLDALDVNTGLPLVVTPGTNASTLNNKYFYINSGANAVEYYVWYNVGGAGVDPTPGGKTEIEVAITSGATKAAVAAATKTALEATDAFDVDVSNSTLTVTNVIPGATTDLVDVNAQHLRYRVMQQGEDRGLVATVILTYNGSGELESAERV